MTYESEDLVHGVELPALDLHVVGVDDAVEDDAIVPVFAAGVVRSVVAADDPGVLEEPVDGVEEVVVEVAHHVDHAHDELHQSVLGDVGHGPCRRGVPVLVGLLSHGDVVGIRS